MKKRQIQYLDISDNPLGPKGVAHSFILPQQRAWSLLTLNLSRTRLGPSGGTIVGDLIASPNCQLAHLNLNGNNLSDEGLINFSEACGRRNGRCMLRSLELSNNAIARDGLDAMAAWMSPKTVPFLQWLSLSFNPIDNYGFAPLMRSVKQLKIRILYLRDTFGSGIADPMNEESARCLSLCLHDARRRKL